MFDWVPLRVWLLIGIGAIAYRPTSYALKYFTQSPSLHDITRPKADFSWRTRTLLIQSLIVVAASIALGALIFTPVAEQFAKSRIFWPIVITCLGAWVLSTVPKGLLAGKVEPFVNGINKSYVRSSQPKRFWAPLTWNGLLGVAMLWCGYQLNEESAREPVVGDAQINTSVGDAGQHYRAGIAYQSAQNPRLAIDEFSAAIRIDPDLAKAYAGRSVAFEQVGNAEAAEIDRKIATQLEAEQVAPGHVER